MKRRKKGLLAGSELKERAEQLGVSMDRLYNSNGLMSETELQKRVLEAERGERERKLWILALVSAIASLASALAAWLAVWKA